jgi:hypothetical protein
LADREQQARRPVVIFAPATLCEQWQTEMLDKLGIPCARWDTVRKVWLDDQERAISPAGREHIARCPLRIGIVSTGLMMRHSAEKQHLLGLRFGLVILDEAHKARTRQGFGAGRRHAERAAGLHARDRRPVRSCAAGHGDADPDPAARSVGLDRHPAPGQRQLRAGQRLRAWHRAG